MSLMEAMAAGMPVIVSAIRGNVDLISDGENGYLFNSCNVNRCQRLSEYLAEDSSQLEMFKKNNLLKVQKYKKSVIKNKLREIYQAHLGCK